MSQCHWSQILVVTGALLEIGALVLIVLEVMDRFRAAAEFEREGTTQTSTSALAGVATVRGTAHVASASPLTLAQRVERLEAQVESVETKLVGEMDDLRHDLSRQVHEVSRRAADDALRDARQEFDRLRNLVKPLTSRFHWSLIGVGLLFLGIVCTTTAAFLSQSC